MNKKSAVGLILFPVLLMAEFQAPPGYGNSNNEGSSQNSRISVMYPMDTSSEARRMPSKLQQNRFEINIDQDEVEYTRTRKQRFEKLMDGTYDVNIMQKVDVRPFRAIDDIDLLTNHTTTVVFPDRYRIQKAIASTELKENRISQNILFLQGKKDFLEGDITVSLTDGKKNVVTKLIINRFVKNSNRKLNIFKPFIRYVEIPKITDYQTLKIYFKLYGSKRISYFNKDHKYDIIEYKKIPFYIIRDDKFGTIEYKGVNFRIANKI